MSKLRVGLIGAGNIAGTHMGAYKHNPNAEVVAVCDIDIDKCNAFADRNNIPKRFASVAEMLANVELDAADVCVWNCAHAECAIAALNAGLDVMCEKPMAMNAAEAEAMLDAAKKNGKLLMLGFVTRFSTEARIAKDFIDQGYFGDIYYSKATYMRRNGNPGGWFADKDRSGGGPIIDIGVHPLDLTRYLMGNPEPVSVFAVTSDLLHDDRAKLKTSVGWHPDGADPKKDKCTVESNAVGIIRYANGASTLLEASYALNCEPKGERSLYGTKGGICLDGMKIYSEMNGFMTDVQLKDLSTYCENKEMFQAEIDHFVDCCQNKTECMSPAADGVVIMKILDALYESAKTGKSVDIK
ncbi:MAG: Gfo/Idh/MocA family oxidoreductase [Clostridiales bacterium]|nr:Gfo/Idh/MocA family oxidoreductase [Clostridiales bacterium]